MSATPELDPPGALPRGTRLGEFEIRRVLGIGGFGIVYLAFDHALEREVAVKEYMPASLAGRTANLQVSILSQAHAETFALGLRSFVNEARLLARFDHPSLVKVHRYWEDNQTAYMAMPYYVGSNLQRVRKQMAHSPDEAWIRAIVEPLLGAIERLHGEAVFHRDISPDNVIVQPDGRPVLLDFGAARRVLSDKSMALTAILKPAYAPIEQYAEAGAVKQGPWTDLYSLGATMHYLLLGKAPPPATARTVQDDAQPLAMQALPGCSPVFLHTIDWMLRPRPADRPQSVAELRAVLAGQAEVPEPAGPAWARTQVMRPEVPTEVLPRPVQPSASAPAAPATAPASQEPEDTIVAPAPAGSPAPSPRARASAPALTSPAASRSRLPAILAAVAVAGAASAWWLWRPAASTPSPGLPAAASAAAVAGSAPGSAPTLAQREPALAPVPAPAPTPASVAAPTLPPATTTTAAAIAASRATAPVRSGSSSNPTIAAASRPQGTGARPSAATAAAPLLPAPSITSPAQEAARPTLTAATAPPSPAAASGTGYGSLTGRAQQPPATREADPMVQARVLGPSERCEGRVLLAYQSCVDNQCKLPELQDHPECQRLKRDQDKRNNRY